jgi:hypothetical protein
MTTQAKVLLLFLLFTLASTLSLSAQNYDRAIGLRMGFPAGLTYKQFLNHSMALEILAGIQRSTSIEGNAGFDVTALWENHSDSFVPELQFVYGIGAHAGMFKDKSNIGMDGIFGLEYTLNAPVCFSFDIKPSLALLGSNIRYVSGGGFSLRYIF